jgi:hypothetical protein
MSEEIEKVVSHVPYQNAYRATLDDPDKEEVQEEPITEETVTQEPASNEEKTWKKRYGDLLSWVDKDLKPKLADLESKLKGTASVQNTSTELPKEDTDIAVWLSNNTQVSQYIERLVNERVKPTEEKLSAIEAERADNLKKSAYEKLLDEHPDFPELAQSTDFQVWLSNQQPWAKDALLRDDNVNAEAASDVIYLYKKKNNISSPENKKKKAEKDAAETTKVRSRVSEPSGSDGIVYSESLIQKMQKNSHWFEEHEKAIEAAQRSGKFVYDILDAAR